METYISDINEMLFMAYVHGGDSGGPYGINEEGIAFAIKQFLVHSSLENQYTFGTLNRESNNCIYFDVPQIINS